MHSENCPSVNVRDGSEAPSVTNSMMNSSILEEDLALSSSMHDKSNEPDSKFVFYVPKPCKVVYLNEETMDCNYAETTETPKKLTDKRDLSAYDPSSPELFQTDDEDDDTTKTSSRVFKRISSQRSLPPPATIVPRKLTQEERILQSDKYLLAKIRKSLTGIPPPPKLTICQNDCDDILTYIKQNRRFFWADPLQNDKTLCKDAANDVQTINNTTNHSNSSNNKDNDKVSSPRSKSLRNLTHAFDACDQSSSSVSTNRPDVSNDGNLSHSSSRLTLIINSNNNTETSMDTNGRESTTESDASLSSITTNTASVSTETGSNCKLDSSNYGNFGKRVTFSVPEDEYLAIYRTIDEVEAKSLPWPLIYKHKAHGVYYNRNKYIEDFENLTMKLCARFIGNETQSTCTSWFTKQVPGSAKKRNLLGKRAIGQSPGKRLSHLARRRRTFSSANLQGMADKKQLVLNLKRPMIKKGKSPRGKSPRGRSPRGKSPRSSTTKRICRRLLIDGPSPSKSKFDTSKRALFQSPSADRAGPSKNISMNGLNSDPQKIKRALFTTTPKKNSSSNDNSGEASRKRKSEDELDGSRLKRPKSLSFDCSYNVDSRSKDAWMDKFTGGNVIKRNESLSQPIKTELSEINRKKLLWAVHEALKSRGIGMSHPKFKPYAVELAKTVRRLMPDLYNKNAAKKPGSTSDRMLKLAKNHVILVVEPKCD